MALFLQNMDIQNFLLSWYSSTYLIHS